MHLPKLTGKSAARQEFRRASSILSVCVVALIATVGLHAGEIAESVRAEDFGFSIRSPEVVTGGWWLGIRSRLPLPGLQPHRSNIQACC